MADRISREKLLEFTAEPGERKDAILDPVTNTETFLNEVASAEVGALSNISNLLGFVPSTFLEGRESEAYKSTKKILKDTTKSKPERVLELLKVPFGENKYDPLDAILGEGVTLATKEAFLEDEKGL